MRISKKILAAVLAALMVIAMMPVTALAEYTGSTPILSKDLTVDDEWNTFEAWLEGSVSDYDGGCFNLTEDVHITEPIVIPENVHVQFDLNGFSIIGDVAGKMIQNHGTVEFVDYYGRGGQVYNTNVGGQGRDALINYGTLTIDADVWFGDNDKDMTNANPVNRGAAIRNYGTATINNGHYTACDNFTNGGYAYALINGDENANPIMTINNATVYGKNNGNVANNDGVVTINGGTFTLVKGSAQNGYNVYVWGDAVTDVVGGTFSSTGNTAAVCVDVEDYESAAINISGGSFTYNTKFKASSSTNNKVKVYGGTFSGDVSAYLDESCAQDVNGTVSQAYVAKIGTDYYATVEDAAAASQEGDTITLVADDDMSVRYPTTNYTHHIELNGVTLDLNGHTITNVSHGTMWLCKNAVIKNGTFAGKKATSDDRYYALSIWGKNVEELGTETTEKGYNVTVENVTAIGGINVYYHENVVLKNCTCTGKMYYAVFVNQDTDVTIESGNYSPAANITALVGAAQYPGSSLTIKGGNFTVPAGKPLVLNNAGKNRVVISGGFYHYTDETVYTVPSNNVANGYKQDETTGEVYPAVADEMSISVEDDVDINLYIEDTADEIEYFEFTMPADPDSASSDPVEDWVATDDMDKNAKGQYEFKFELAPAQIRDTIVVKAYKAGSSEPVKEVETTVADYCETIIGIVENNPTAFGEKSAELADLAKSTLDYGMATSDYFNYNESAYSSQSQYFTEAPELPEKTASNFSDIVISGVTYRAVSTPEIRFYVDNNYINIETAAYLNSLGITTNVAGTSAKFVRLDDGRIMLQIKGINITDFNKQIVVSIGGNQVLGYTPLTWVNQAMNSGYSGLEALGNSIGNYYLKSVAYFD